MLDAHATAGHDDSVHTVTVTTQCGAPRCGRESRWPRRNRTVGFCDECLTALTAACNATVVGLGDHARDRFRTRHNPCGAVVDVSLSMLRRGGWTCQMYKWIDLGPRNRALGAVTAQWPVARQEQLLRAASMRSLLPLGDADGEEPINYECLECGGAAADSVFGIAEGLRLSWLPCAHCNAARFKPTTTTIASRLHELGLRLLQDYTGDPGKPLQAVCHRCDTPRAVSWTSICSGAPPCLRCDGARLNPTAPHRVYLMHFPHLGDAGVYKIGITHCANDSRLRDHARNGGLLLHTVQVPDRATALHIERLILNHYQPIAPVSLRRDLLPQGGATESWSAHIGYPDLLAIAPT